MEKWNVVFDFVNTYISMIYCILIDFLWMYFGYCLNVIFLDYFMLLNRVAFYSGRPVFFALTPKDA